MALRLLVKGMPLRGVADVMEVKLDAVRHWLRVAAQQGEEVSAMLVRELKVTQVELDALWSFVKKTIFAAERTFGGRDLDRNCLGHGIADDDFLLHRPNGVLPG